MNDVIVNLLDHLEVILDYYTYNKPIDDTLVHGSTILEGLVSEDPFIVAKAVVAAQLYIDKFNKSLHIN